MYSMSSTQITMFVRPFEQRIKNNFSHHLYVFTFRKCMFQFICFGRYIFSACVTYLSSSCSKLTAVSHPTKTAEPGLVPPTFGLHVALPIGLQR